MSDAARRCAFLLLVTCAGCSSSSDAEPTTAVELAEQFELASCERQVECGRMPDLDLCLEVTDDAPTDDDFSYAAVIDGVGAGRILLDQDIAARCITAVRELPCEPDQQQDPREAACADLFRGTVVEGGDCSTHLDCLSGHCSGLLCDSQCCSGVCVEPYPVAVIVGEGESCEDEDTACGDGLFCQYDGLFGASTCVSRLEAGQTCNWDDECASGLVCLGSGTDHATCGAARREGEPCDPTAYSDCAEWPSFFCDPDARSCARRKALGDPCRVVEGTYDEGCPAYGWCSGGTCVLRPLEGEPCDEVDCLGELFCGDDDVCGPAESFGVSCESDGDQDHP